MWKDLIKYNFMKNARQPMHELPDTFEELNESFKELIIKNKVELFSKEYYQEQIYFVLSLIN